MTNEKFKRGDKVRVGADSTGHGFAPGTEATVVGVPKNGNTYFVTTRDDWEAFPNDGEDTDIPWEAGVSAYVTVGGEFYDQVVLVEDEPAPYKASVGERVRIVESYFSQNARKSRHEDYRPGLIGAVGTVTVVGDDFVTLRLDKETEGYTELRVPAVAPVDDKPLAAGDRVVRTGPHTIHEGDGYDYGDRECEIGSVGTITGHGSRDTVYVLWDGRGNGSAITASSLARHVESEPEPEPEEEEEERPLKVGDLVRILPGASCYHGFKVGDVTSIKGVVNGEWRTEYFLLDGESGLFWDEELELVEGTEPEIKVEEADLWDLRDADGTLLATITLKDGQRLVKRED